jgi:hypothetical protein
MWRQNVKRSKVTLDALTVRRAVTALKRGLSSSGQLQHLSDALARHAHNRHEIFLPGFDLFSGGDKRAPCTWLLPKLISGEAELLYAYESVADRPMGGFRAPYEIPTQVLLDAGNPRAKVKLGDSARSSHWFTPMVRLVAYAQVRAEAQANVTGGTYSIHIGNGYMEVSPKGVYSNLEGRFVPAVSPPADIAEAVMAVPGVVTTHKIISALHELAQEADHSTLLALTACTHALHEGLVSPSKLLHMLNHTVYRAGRDTPSLQPERAVRYTETDPNWVVQSIQQTLNSLQKNGPYVREAFYSAAVPGLYTSREFSNRFGHPSNHKPGTVRDSTLVKWREAVKQRAKELTDLTPP